ncbi:mitochondrial import inner membrane translocase subunit TIM50-A-like [Lycorma delicatula]|uniref:mitochondrial import inner membrane translocase subunit TIM50-A-like n=1 Tax=Lycorma delicatula TaxID=130591 RepID=UPI003F50D600
MYKCIKFKLINSAIFSPFTFNLLCTSFIQNYSNDFQKAIKVLFHMKQCLNQCTKEFNENGEESEKNWITNWMESDWYKYKENKLINNLEYSSFTCDLPLYTSCFRYYSNNFKKDENILSCLKYSTQYKKIEEENLHLTEKRINWVRIKMICLFLSLILCWIFYVFGSPYKDKKGNIIKDEFSELKLPKQYVKRILKGMDSFLNSMNQPVMHKLLPDSETLKYTLQFNNYSFLFKPKYTLVLELTDLLVHADWTYETGWRFKKRPGVDKFLELVALPLFELVVFTIIQNRVACPLLEELDPQRYIVFKLSKTSTELIDGQYVKNLDYLNRDLKKVIVVDWNENSVKLHRNNAIIIPRWTGQDDDRTLVELALFLRTIAYTDVEDVREILKYYTEFDNPVEAYRENNRKLSDKIKTRNN